jgi:WD40 repeat protein
VKVTEPRVSPKFTVLCWQVLKMLSWVWSDENQTAEYSILSTPGSDLIDSNPIRSQDYGHEFSVYCLHIAFDRFVISGSYELILVEDIDSGEEFKCYTGDFDWVYSLKMIYGVTPLLASAHRDSFIRLWDYFDSNPSPIRILSGHSHAVVSLEILQGVNPLIVSGSFDCTVSVWRDNGVRIRILIAATRAIRNVSILQNATPGPLIVCGDDNGDIYIWNFEYNLVRCIKLDSFPIKSLVTIMHKEVPMVIVGRDTGQICIYNIRDGSEVLNIDAHPVAVRALATYEVSNYDPQHNLMLSTISLSIL